VTPFGALPLADRVKGVSVVSRKNQITIPADVMREAGLAPGDDVRVRSAGAGRIELIKTDELVDQFAGMFDETVYPAGYLDDIRAGWR
jgi:AbrB family looped-hinge helix DNA binding protein